jgi:hypothetical protein
MLSADAGATPSLHRSRSSPPTTRNRTRRRDGCCASSSFTQKQLEAFACRGETLQFSVCNFQRAKFGGADRNRTDDIQLAKLALSQLSYSPKPSPATPSRRRPGKTVGLGRLELPTSRLSGVRSSQLSYRPRAAIRINTPTVSKSLTTRVALSKLNSESVKLQVMT